MSKEITPQQLARADRQNRLPPLNQVAIEMVNALPPLTKNVPWEETYESVAEQLLIRAFRHAFYGIDEHFPVHLQTVAIAVKKATEKIRKIDSTYPVSPSEAYVVQGLGHDVGKLLTPQYMRDEVVMRMMNRRLGIDPKYDDLIFPKDKFVNKTTYKIGKERLHRPDTTRKPSDFSYLSFQNMPIPARIHDLFDNIARYEEGGYGDITPIAKRLQYTADQSKRYGTLPGNVYGISRQSRLNLDQGRQIAANTAVVSELVWFEKRYNREAFQTWKAQFKEQKIYDAYKTKHPDDKTKKKTVLKKLFRDAFVEAVYNRSFPSLAMEVLDETKVELQSDHSKQLIEQCIQQLREGKRDHHIIEQKDIPDVQTVVFDLGNVVVDVSDDDLFQATAHAFEQQGIKTVTLSDIKKAITSTIDQGITADTEDKQWAYIKKIYNLLNITCPDKLSDAFKPFQHPDIYHIRPEMAELITWILTKTNARVVILSDLIAPVVEPLELMLEQHIPELYDETFKERVHFRYSARTGISKRQNDQAYIALLDSLGINEDQRANVLFIDDNEKYTQTAEALRIRTITYDTTDPYFSKTLSNTIRHVMLLKAKE